MKQQPASKATRPARQNAPPRPISVAVAYGKKVSSASEALACVKDKRYLDGFIDGFAACVAQWRRAIS